MHTDMHLDLYIYIYICVCACVCVCACACMCVCACVGAFRMLCSIYVCGDIHLDVDIEIDT